jgi:large repetitive protein
MAGGASGLADVSITKAADMSAVSSGSTITYTLIVQNTGPSSAQNVTVTDAIAPASYSDVKVDTSQGTCNATVSCSLGTVTANSTVTITITATVIARDTTLTNSASVSTSTPDPNLVNNTDSATVTVPGTADLAIAKAGSPANPTQGGTDTFTLTVSNSGPDTARGVVVNDTLPSQFTAATASGGGFTCTVPGGPGGTVVCTLATLAPTGGTPVTITITGTVGGAAGQSIADGATVTSNTGDPDLSNNTDTLNQLIGPVADLGISKTALLSDGVTPVTDPLAVGGAFIYRLIVTNQGPSDATGVVVRDTLPTGLTLIAPIPAGCAGTTAITCTVGTVTAGASVTRDLNVGVGAGASNTAPTNTATVSSTTVDPNAVNNSASATVGIGSVANLALAKSVSPQTANVGDLVTYTLGVTDSISIGEGGVGPRVDSEPRGVLSATRSQPGCSSSRRRPARYARTIRAHQRPSPAASVPSRRVPT